MGGQRPVDDAAAALCCCSLVGEEKHAHGQVPRLEAMVQALSRELRDA